MKNIANVRASFFFLFLPFLLVMPFSTPCRLWRASPGPGGACSADQGAGKVVAALQLASGCFHCCSRAKIRAIPLRSEALSCPSFLMMLAYQVLSVIPADERFSLSLDQAFTCLRLKCPRCNLLAHAQSCFQFRVFALPPYWRYLSVVCEN